MALKLARGAAPVVIALPLLLALVVLVAQVAGAPREHSVKSPGARQISYRLAGYANRSVEGPVAPTLSLEGLRCEAWRTGGNQTCPEPSVLDGMFWPQEQQAADLLYVAVPSTSCLPSPTHIDVEYRAAKLTLHCHVAAPWINLDRPPPGQAAQPTVVLVVVAIVGLPAGSTEVVLENRVERWFKDDVSSAALGAVTFG